MLLILNRQLLSEKIIEQVILSCIRDKEKSAFILSGPVNLGRSANGYFCDRRKRAIKWDLESLNFTIYLAFIK